ncbi:MAG: RIP metalloprotease RseP, partial [Cyanobacteria bacterium P01_H01_bin.121]
GGFVGFPDDDPESDIPPQDPNLLKNRPIMDRAIVISAGVVANLLFAYLVFVAQFASVGVPQSFIAQPGVVVPQVLSESSPAAQAGLRAGDVILSASGIEFGTDDKSVESLVNLIQEKGEQPIDLTVQRQTNMLELTVVPELNDQGKPVIGVQLQRNGELQYRRASTVFEVFSLAAQEFQGMLLQTVQGFATLLTNFSQMAGQVAGPVGIVEQGAGLVATNAASLFPFTAIISINLAIINILPLPALDGGQLAFLLVEALRGKPLPERLQENVMQTGLVLLLGLGVFLIVRDTSQLEIFQDLIP